MELKHTFETPSEKRNDITFELTEGGIYEKPTSWMYSSTTPAISVTQRFSEGVSTHISIPINQVEKFCDELRKFAEALKQLEQKK